MVLVSPAGPVEGRFIRGDANGDGRIDIADAIWALSSLFVGGPPTACPDAADANDDSAVDVSDPIFLLGYQFLGSRAPSAPFPECGNDPDLAEDGLDCPEDQSACRDS